MIDQLLNPQLVEALGWTLLHSLWQGAIFAISLALMFVILRNYSAGSRYVVAAGLLLAFFITTSGTFVHQWKVANIELQAAVGQSAHKSSVPINLNNENQLASPLGQELFDKAEVDKATQLTLLESMQGYYQKHLPLLVTIWLIGFVFLQLKFIGQLAYIQRLKFAGVQLFPEEWAAKFDELETKLRLRKKVKYLISVRIESPMVVGWLKPVVLMPQQLFKSLAETELYAILAHELAHIRREDFIVNIVQTVLCNIFFFHPGINWMSKRVDEEREHCCDDLAVMASGEASSYARTLINVSELSLSIKNGNPALAMSLGGKFKKRKPSGFTARIHRLFEVKNGGGSFRESFATLNILLLALLLGVAATGPVEQSNNLKSFMEINENEVKNENGEQTLNEINLAIKEKNDSDLNINIEVENLIKLKHNLDSDSTDIYGNGIKQSLEELSQLPINNIISTREEAAASPVMPSNVLHNADARIDALVMACAEGDLEFVQTLVKAGIDINGIGSEGFTPLMMATSNDEAKVVAYLIEQEVDVNKVINGWTALIEAADEGALESMKLLIDAGADVNYFYVLGSPTAITMTASEGNLGCMKLLLKHGADINGVGNSMKPLHSAAEENNIRIIDYIISQRVEINKKDIFGRTALMYAASEGNLQVVIKLIDGGADASIEDKRGYTAANYAEDKDEYEVVKYFGYEDTPYIHQLTNEGLMDRVKSMIENGEDVNARDSYGRTPLHLASANNHTNNMRDLIEFGAELDVQDSQGRTSMMYAAAASHGKAVALLVSEGANAQIQDVDGMRAYEWAKTNGASDLVKFLGLITDDEKNNEKAIRELEKQHQKRELENEKALKEIEKEYQKKELEKEKASREAEKQQRKMELENQKQEAKRIESCDKNQESFHVSRDGQHLRQYDMNNVTPELFDAIKHGSVERCKKIIREGGSVNDSDDTGQTALMIASRHNDIRIAKFLIEQGANVNSSSVSGLTALHYAALDNHIQFAQLLISNNANLDPTMKYSSTDGCYGPNCKDEKSLVYEFTGATPLLVAVESNHEEFVNLLVSAGANPNYKMTKKEYRFKKSSRNYLVRNEVFGIDKDFLNDSELIDSTNNWTPYKQAEYMNKTSMLRLFTK